MISLTKRYNTIVIGVGGMGSATCYELAKRGRRVLGLERFDIPHELGSSHGHTRIIRLAYYEHPSYVMLLHRAYELFHQIQEKSGEQLLVYTGSIDAGPADSWVFKGSLQSCLEHGLPHEVLTGMEVNHRFPGYALSHETMALYQPKGGFLRPERCIVAYVFEAMKLGAEIHGREEVLEWQPYGDGVRVITNRDIYEADSLVVTAGAWNYQMVDVLQGLSVPERQVLAWLQPRRPEKFTVENFPVFNLLVDEGRYYGFPVYSIPGFKFGKYHHFEESGDPDRLDREPNALDEEMLREFAARYFPDGCEATMSLAACLFTNTSDGHFLIDTHPVYPQVSFAAGFSGHGFKFASVMGEIMADLAERGQTRHNIEFFRVERLAGRPRQPIAGAAQPRLTERMLTSYNPALRAPSLRGGRGLEQPHYRGQRRSQALDRRQDPYRLRRAGLHHRRTQDQLRPDYNGYSSTLAEDGLGAIKPFW